MQEGVGLTAMDAEEEELTEVEEEEPTMDRVSGSGTDLATCAPEGIAIVARFKQRGQPHERLRIGPTL
jgi:hypothetical protein